MLDHFSLCVHHLTVYSGAEYGYGKPLLARSLYVVLSPVVFVPAVAVRPSSPRSRVAPTVEPPDAVALVRTEFRGYFR